ncbi:hypothetical protein [Aridibaculum aurantiacum]|uniref:hypothetical protein n=1 Tax=Aridibaculum aurantiacum TaxID=2810307 RepID=UPI001A97739B|nr:hypothetical protein [Aridibaculum aurantiacum]
MAFATAYNVSAQVVVSGTVYDITRKTPIEAVSVLSTSGRGTFTDSAGRYSITVSPNDSIYFSYLNKATPKYPVASIPNIYSFDISILKKVQELPGVTVKPRNYRMDSIQNRTDYAKIFGYSKPGIKTSTLSTPGAAGVGIDLNELINMFRFRKIRSTMAFQRRLIQEEKDKYINHRFNKGLVRKLTGLTSPEIDSFMVEYRPTYEMVVHLNDLEFGHFIQEAYKFFKRGIKVNRQVLQRQEED